MQFSFIGLGLIGGSIAKALRKYLPDSIICAYSNDLSSLQLAKEDGVIDYILPSVEHSTSDADTTSHLEQTDVFFLCAPVEYNLMYLGMLVPFLKPSAILTDVGSTKSSIHQAAKDLGLQAYFIGGHPMAGSEKTGYTSSDSLILENAYYILTKSDETPEGKYQTLSHILRTIKAIPFAMEEMLHDKSVAAVSHLPHILASALCNVIKSQDSSNVLRQIAAGGFKDITRIASSSPIMWEQICKTNKTAILPILQKYIRYLEDIATDLKEDTPNAIHDRFAMSRDYRNRLSDIPFGLIQSHFSFSVKVADRPGAISIVSAILAANAISIKNIGINHNRELGEGALHISFYDSNSCELAKKVLIGYHYDVV